MDVACVVWPNFERLVINFSGMRSESAADIYEGAQPQRHERATHD